MTDVSRFRVFSDEQWAILEPLLPSHQGKVGRPFGDHRHVVEGIAYRYRTGVAWRDLPAEFGPWQTLWKRHRKYAQDGTWDRISQLMTGATWTGRSVSMPPSRGRISTRPIPPDRISPQGAFFELHVYRA